MRYQFLDFHPLSLVMVMAALMATPFYVLLVYTFSGASRVKGAVAGAGFLVFGAVMALVCVAAVPMRMGPSGGLIVLTCWVAPTAILFARRRWFLAEPLSQQWLIGLQLWRAIGAAFLLEMGRGNIPGSFAYPAGIGDIAVAALAAGVLIAYRNRPSIPEGAVRAVLFLGVADFLSAFFFGFTSSPGPQQLFFGVQNNSLLFPTGLIPLFLVPYAIFFHGLSWMQLRRTKSGAIC